MTNVLEIFTDFVCPWCYLGEKHLQQAIRNRDVSVKYVYFPLHSETPFEGMTLEQLFAGRGMDVAASQEKLGLTMRNEGLCYGPRTHTYNSLGAQRLAKYIESFDSDRGRALGSQFRAEVFLAYFERGENIAKPEVLQEICRQIGMLDFDVEIALSDSKASAAIDDDWAYCRKMNVSGVPAYQFGEHWVHGCRGVDALQSLLRVEMEE